METNIHATMDANQTNVVIPQEPRQMVSEAKETVLQDKCKEEVDSGKDIQSDQYSQKEYEELQSVIGKKERNESLVRKFLYAARKVIMAPVQILIIKPVQKIGDAMNLLLMPKACRQKLYDDAIDRAKETIAREQKEALKEDASTISKKMKIVRDKNLSDVDQIRELARLSHSSEKTVTAKTHEGALRFEKIGDTVLIKHGLPKQRTAESAVSYSFRTVGGIVFNKFGVAIKDETDIYDAIKQIRMDKGFDKAARGIDDNTIIENANNYGIAEEDTRKTEVSDNMDEKIVSGNTKVVEEEILDIIDIEDYEAEDDFEKKPFEAAYELSEKPPSYEEFVASLQEDSINKSQGSGHQPPMTGILCPNMSLTDVQPGFVVDEETPDITDFQAVTYDKEPDYDKNPIMEEIRAVYNDMESFESIMADAVGRASNGNELSQKEPDIEWG